MKVLLRLEEVLMFCLAVYLNTLLPYETWLYWALFLAPDIGFVGYAFNTRIGAMTYNAFHHKGVAIAFYLAGAWWSLTSLQFVGLLLFGHSSFDRAVGFELRDVEKLARRA